MHDAQTTVGAGIKAKQVVLDINVVAPTGTWAQRLLSALNPINWFVQPSLEMGKKRLVSS